MTDINCGGLFPGLSLDENSSILVGVAQQLLTMMYKIFPSESEMAAFTQLLLCDLLRHIYVFVCSYSPIRITVFSFRLPSELFNTVLFIASVFANIIIIALVNEIRMWQKPQM